MGSAEEHRLTTLLYIAGLKRGPFLRIEQVPAAGQASTT